ncbi:MAG: polyprenyl synthetase family protein, partial [Lentimicrobiaceae bacterium]|nr:polyprenyl synthetase family protein [Lentimicrobiaceae bacterium]
SVIDLKEKKLTLPIIYLLQQLNRKEKRQAINIIKNQKAHPDKVKQLIEKVKEKGGIAYAEKMMMDYRRRAIELLHTFPESNYRDSLEHLVIYTTERKK